MLSFDPAERVNCEQALNHSYFQEWYDPEDTPLCETVRECHGLPWGFPE